MNLHRMLQARAAEGRPLRVGLIGAGKFGAMYLAQAPHTPGIHIVGIADLAPDRAQASLAANRLGARAVRRALVRRGWQVRRDIRHRRRARPDRSAPDIEIVIDATGDPAAASATRSLLCCTASTS